MAYERLLSYPIPATLQALNLKLLEFENPHSVRSKLVEYDLSHSPN